MVITGSGFCAQNLLLTQETQILIKNWRVYYNQVPPHSAFDYRLPTGDDPRPDERPESIFDSGTMIEGSHLPH